MKHDTPSVAREHAPDISGVSWKIWLITASRLVLNTGRRFAYPFAPALSRGLGVSLTAITSLIAMNQATTLLGLLIGPLTDRCGYRRMMLIGLGVLILGMTAASLFPGYVTVLIALSFAGLGKTIFDPAMQSYISEFVPFDRRARAIGVLEFAWAGSTLVGIPLISILIDRLGWRSPFFVLSGVGFLSLTALYLLLPREPVHERPRQLEWGFLQTLRALLKSPVALATLVFGFFFSLANDNLFVIYGAWMEYTFHVSIVTIGMSATVIGFAELLGEFLTAVVSDRLGLHRGVVLGLSLCLVTYSFLPWADSFSLALIALFFIFLTVEFTMVTFLSLCTELLPGSRATMLAGFFAAAGLGRITGAFIGGIVWLRGGIVANSFVAVAACSLALVSLSWGLRKWKQSHHQKENSLTKN